MLIVGTQAIPSTLLDCGQVDRHDQVQRRRWVWRSNLWGPSRLERRQRQNGKQSDTRSTVVEICALAMNITVILMFLMPPLSFIVGALLTLFDDLRCSAAKL